MCCCVTLQISIKKIYLMLMEIIWVAVKYKHEWQKIKKGHKKKQQKSITK